MFMKKYPIIVSIVVLIFIAIIMIDPLTCYYNQKYGMDFNGERAKINLIPVKAVYKMNWFEKYIAFDFLPVQPDNDMKYFERKRMFFKNGILKSECDVFKLMSKDSSTLSKIFKLYDFQEKRDDYSLEIYHFDINGDMNYFEKQINLNRQFVDSLLNNWQKIY